MADINLQQYGLTYLFPYQRLVIENILHNEQQATAATAVAANSKATPHPAQPQRLDTLGDSRRNQIIILPTAAGKSLCFQLPAAYLAGITIVIYPLLGLIADQSRRLQQLGIPADELTGKMSRQQKLRLLADAQAGRVRVLLTNPETVLLPYVIERLRQIRCSHLVIDEAHCISEWGKSFRPVYRALGSVAQQIDFRSISAFTATASRDIITDIADTLFGGRDVHIVSGNPDRENISYCVRPTLSVTHSVVTAASRAGAATTADAIGVHTPMIIFCASRADSARYAHLIRQHSSAEVFFYHAGLTPAEKERVERWFFASKDGILCATCAYGMGMDKGDIRSVVHAFLPASVESYLQESGRGGRDGKPATSVLYCSPATIHHARRQQGDHPLLAYVTDHTACRRATLLQALGVDPPPCNGCDTCSGLPPGLSRAERVILRYLLRHQRTMALDELAHRRSFRAAIQAVHIHDALEYIDCLREEQLLTERAGGWRQGYSLSAAARRLLRTSMFT